MPELTSDRDDPRLNDRSPTGQQSVYLVLSAEDRAKGYTRPLRRAYRHVGGLQGCRTVTTMGLALCETYAVDPKFYGATFCAACNRHLPVGEFVWIESDGSDGAIVGS
jgi:hypothetical protein